MALHNRKSLKARRKQLRNHGTAAEAVLWTRLKKRQLYGRKFRRQHSVGPFIVDFYCPAERLALELDGAIHDDPEQARYDHERTRFLNQMGIRVIRIKNRAVFSSIEMVLAHIAGHFGEGDDNATEALPL